LLPQIFVTAGVETIINDMVEAQKSSGSRGIKATKPCRMCGIHKNAVADQTFDVCQHRKTNVTRADLRRDGTPDDLKDAGMYPTATFFEDKRVFVDVTTQVPVEPYHAEILGHQKLLMTNILQSLTVGGRKVLGDRLHSIQLPKHWTEALPELVLTKKGTFSASGQDMKHLTQVLPFAFVNHSLLATHITKHEHERLAQTFPGRTTRSANARLQLWASAALACSVAAADAHRLVFARKRDFAFDEMVMLRSDGAGPLFDLDQAVKKSRTLVAEFWPGIFDGRPNAHTGLHYPEAAHLFGTIASLSAESFERHHKDIRAAAPRLSGRHATVELLHHDNISRSIRFLAVLAARGGALSEHCNLTDEAEEVLGNHIDDKLFARLFKGPTHRKRGQFYGDGGATKATTTVTVRHDTHTHQTVWTGRQHVSWAYCGSTMDPVGMSEASMWSISLRGLHIATLLNGRKRRYRSSSVHVRVCTPRQPPRQIKGCVLTTMRPGVLHDHRTLRETARARTSIPAMSQQ
jgi:hypothetical protein